MDKTILSILIVLNFLSAYSQKTTKVKSGNIQKSLLIIPIKNENVRISNKIYRITKYNNVSIDSCIKTIKDVMVKALREEFGSYNIHLLGIDDTLKVFIDSLKYAKKFSTYHLKKIKESYGFKKNYYTNEDSYKVFYRACDLDSNDIVKLMEIRQFFNYDYIIFINKFEISGNYFSMHYDLFDNKLSRILGSKSESKHKLGSKMYFEVLMHYAKMPCKAAYQYIKWVLK